MQLILANPRGFCAGVDRAIEIVNRALEIYGAPVYVRHEVVHNKAVVDDLTERGAVFIEEVSQAPDNCILIFSAHGVSQMVRQEAEQRQLTLFDATCPLVTKVHLEVARYSKQGIHCILIGHKGHPEVDGTLGQYQANEQSAIHLVENKFDVEKLTIKEHEKVAYVTQTTLSLDDTNEIVKALKSRYPHIIGPKNNDICYATQNRQDAVKRLAKGSDSVFVVGSQNSSNSNRLKEVAEKQGAKAYLIDNADEISHEMLSGVDSIGLTAGASAPEYLVENVKKRFLQFGLKQQMITEDDGNRENITFQIPIELRKPN